MPDAASRTDLPDEEATHALRVLRLKAGDEIFLMDGEGTFYEAEVTLATNKRCLYEIRQTMPQQPTWQGHIHLAIAPTKMMDRIEWMAEKATEIGFDELTFLSCKFSERKTIRTDRIDKIVVSAVKQSHKAWKPAVNDLTAFRDFIEQPRSGRKFICHCYEEIAKKDFFEEISQSPSPTPSNPLNPMLENKQHPSPSNPLNPMLENKQHPSPLNPLNPVFNETGSPMSDITVLVGPEGDFSIDEVRLALQHGYESVSLGTSRLRTETAGLSAVMMANLARRI